jgi:hypothetical protein
MNGAHALAGALAGLSKYLDEQGVGAEALIGEAADAVMTYEKAGRKR